MLDITALTGRQRRSHIEADQRATPHRIGLVDPFLHAPTVVESASVIAGRQERGSCIGHQTGLTVGSEVQCRSQPRAGIEPGRCRSGRVDRGGDTVAITDLAERACESIGVQPDRLRVLLVISAGYETTVNLIDQAIYQVLTRPGLLGQLRTGTITWSQLIEETLARLEAAEALPALFGRFPELTLAVETDELKPLPSFISHGLQSLPVYLDRPHGIEGGCRGA